MQKLFYSNGPPIFTARKRSCGKVMFLHLSVILFTGGGACVVKVGICMVNGACMVKRGRHGKGGMHGNGGCAWQGGHMCDRGCAWWGAEEGVYDGGGGVCVAEVGHGCRRDGH